MTPARRGAIAVFAKRPWPGEVKTRLCPPLTPGQAADLYRCMLDDVLEATAEAARALDLEPLLAVSPPAAGAELVRGAPPEFRAIAQHGADLGARMARVAAELAAGGAGPILLRGSDNPALGVDCIAAACRALESAELAIAPDLDGGYGLIGLQRPVPGLFDHPMSTASVLRDTTANAEARGLRVATLDAHFDLDGAADLARLATLRHGPLARLCRRTLAWLDDEGIWSLLPAAPDAGDARSLASPRDPR